MDDFFSVALALSVSYIEVLVFFNFFGIFLVTYCFAAAPAMTVKNCPLQVETDSQKVKLAQDEESACLPVCFIVIFFILFLIKIFSYFVVYFNKMLYTVS